MCENARLMLVCQKVHFELVRARDGSCAATDAASADADGDVSMPKSDGFDVEKMRECKGVLDNVNQDIESTIRSLGKSEISSALASVYAMYFLVRAEYFKALDDSPLEFFKSALQYIGYAKVVKNEFDWAYDLAVNALRAKSFYDFGELSLQPIMKVLEKESADGRSGQWLLELVRAFISAKLDAFNAVCAKYAKELAAEPSLATDESRALLNEKIRLLALVRLAFYRPATERVIPFSDISKVSDVDVEKVEGLIMRGMSLELMKGTIDGVAGTVTVTYVKPRILDKSEIDAMRERVTTWHGKIGALEGTLAPQIDSLFE
jgi:26S proteasome regulatory subunit N9